MCFEPSVMSLKLIKLQIKIFSVLAIGSEEALIIVNRRAKSSQGSQLQAFQVIKKCVCVCVCVSNAIRD